MIPIVALMRIYRTEFVNGHDPARCADLMTDDYLLHMAGKEYRGRGPGYEPAVTGLFAQFPDLHLTIHEMLTDGARLATRFTLNGTSTRHGGRPASWGGVAQYDWDGGRYTECWVEEDHHLARAQLRSEPVELPEVRPGPPDPWAAALPAPAADGVVEAATEWLTAGGGGLLGPEPTVDRLLAVGRRFAFHTSSTVTHVSGMASIAADGSVHEITTHSDGGPR